MTPFLKQILEGAPEEYDPWLTNQRAKAVEFFVQMNTKIIYVKNLKRHKSETNLIKGKYELKWVFKWGCQLLQRIPRLAFSV